MRVITKHPIAYDSHDHVEPKGTKNDNTRSLKFLNRAEEVIGKPVIRYADLGCSGGGIVSDFIERGHQAVGIEGSDYSLINKRAEWGNEKVAPFLFTADITKPFTIVDGTQHGGCCDLISAWDVLEHIHETDLDQLFTNIRNNLKTGGLFVASVATFEDRGYHVTLQEKPWWLNKFAQHGLKDAEHVKSFDDAWGRSSTFGIVLEKV